MPLVRVICDQVSPGLRPADAIATIRDFQGRRHFLQIEKDFLSHDGTRPSLPVSLVHRDPQTGAVLVELPQEAETGVNRVWVRAEDLADGAEGVP